MCVGVTYIQLQINCKIKTYFNIIFSFTLASEDGVLKILVSLKTKTCDLDPIPTSLVKEYADTLKTLNTYIMHCLRKVVFPIALKLLILLHFSKNQAVHICKVVTHLPPTPGIGGSNPGPYVGKIIDFYQVSSLQCRILANCMYCSIESNMKTQINKAKRSFSPLA